MREDVRITSMSGNPLRQLRTKRGIILYERRGYVATGQTIVTRRTIYAGSGRGAPLQAHLDRLSKGPRR